MYLGYNCYSVLFHEYNSLFFINVSSSSKELLNLKYPGPFVGVLQLVSNKTME